MSENSTEPNGQQYEAYGSREKEDLDKLFSFSKDALREEIEIARSNGDVALLGFISGFAAFKGQIARQIFPLLDMSVEDAVTSLSPEPALVDEWWDIAAICDDAIEQLLPEQTSSE